MISYENLPVKFTLAKYQQKMRLTQRQFYISLLFLIVFILSLIIIINCEYKNLFFLLLILFLFLLYKIQ
jgi:hypothetical protein